MTPKDDKPIVGLRAIQHNWTEHVPSEITGKAYPLPKSQWKLEFRREGEDNWTEIELIEIQGRPHSS